MTTLVPGHAYRLSGIRDSLWGNFHVWFGRPSAIAARYLGSVTGARTWYVFEVWHHEQEIGVLIMNTDDMLQLTIDEVA